MTLAATQFGASGGTGTSSFDVSISGYTGTGTVGLADFTASPLFTGGAFPQTGTYLSNLPVTHQLTPITQDVSSFIRMEVAHNVGFGGFLLEPTNEVIGIPGQFQVDFSSAVLKVNVTSIPEPSSLALLVVGTASIALYAHRRSTRRRPGPRWLMRRWPMVEASRPSIAHRTSSR